MDDEEAYLHNIIIEGTMGEAGTPSAHQQSSPTSEYLNLEGQNYNDYGDEDHQDDEVINSYMSLSNMLCHFINYFLKQSYLSDRNMDRARERASAEDGTSSQKRNTLSQKLTRLGNLSHLGSHWAPSKMQWGSLSEITCRSASFVGGKKVN